MNKTTIHNIKLGIFVITGILALTVGLYFIGSNRNMFGSTFKLYATFHNVGGLQRGNNVRYGGINVGTVKAIKIVNDTVIRVEMSVEADLKKVIRKNSPASVGTDGLMGSKLINIDPGTSDAASINDGDELTSVPAINTDEMLRTLEFTNGNIAIVSANLKDLTENINKSRGTLYKMLMDTSVAVGLQHTLNNMEKVSNNLEDITTDFSTLSNDVKNGKGLLGTLIKDTVITSQLKLTVKQAKESIEQINLSANELKLSLQKINNGNGTLSTLLNDTITSNHLKSSLANIDSSSKSLNENMEALKHSFLLRGYFRRQEKKNKK
ncbi:MAG: MlaD family protein [Bacteroidia bacterium]